MKRRDLGGYALAAVLGLPVALDAFAGADADATRERALAQRCQDAIAVATPAGERPPDASELDFDWPLRTLESMAPVCGEFVLWVLAGNRLGASEPEAALHWFALARSRTALRRRAAPESMGFGGNGAGTVYGAIAATYAPILAAHVEHDPALEVRALETAIAWNLAHSSPHFPASEWPEADAAMRTSLDDALERARARADPDRR